MLKRASHWPLAFSSTTVCQWRKDNHRRPVSPSMASPATAASSAKPAAQLLADALRLSWPYCCCTAAVLTGLNSPLAGEKRHSCQLVALLDSSTSEGDEALALLTSSATDVSSTGVRKDCSMLPSAAARTSRPPLSTSVSHSVHVASSACTAVNACMA